MARDAAEIARLSADAMLAEDKASHAAGMKVDKITPGLAVLSMTVGAEHGQRARPVPRRVHLLLADSAFAFACNSHGQRTRGPALHRLPT